MVLIHGKPQVQKLQLAIIAIQQVAPRRAVLASPSHILSQSVEGGAFLVISLGILAIALFDVVLEGLDPVDFVCLLEGAGEHGRLNHGDGWSGAPEDR